MADERQGLLVNGRIKKKEFKEGQNGNKDRFFIIVDALGMDGVMNIQLPRDTYDKLQVGQNFKSLLDFTVRREGWLTFSPLS